MFKKSFQKTVVGLAVVTACVCALPTSAKAATSTVSVTVNKSSSGVTYYSAAVTKSVAYVDAKIEVVDAGFPTSYYTITTHLVPRDAYTPATDTCTFSSYTSVGTVSYLSGYGSKDSAYRLVGKLNYSSPYSSIQASFRLTP